MSPTSAELDEMYRQACSAGSLLAAVARNVQDVEAASRAGTGATIANSLASDVLSLKVRAVATEARREKPHLTLVQGDKT